MGTETRMRRRVERADLADTLDDVGAVVFGTAFPVVFFLLAAASTIELESAFTLAK